MHGTQHEGWVMLERLTLAGCEGERFVYINPKYVTAVYEKTLLGETWTVVETLPRWAHEVKESAEAVRDMCKGWG